MREMYQIVTTYHDGEIERGKPAPLDSVRFSLDFARCLYRAIPGFTVTASEDRTDVVTKDGRFHEKIEREEIAA